MGENLHDAIGGVVAPLYMGAVVATSPRTGSLRHPVEVLRVEFERTAGVPAEIWVEEARSVAVPDDAIFPSFGLATDLQVLQTTPAVMLEPWPRTRDLRCIAETDGSAKSGLGHAQLANPRHKDAERLEMDGPS